MPRGGQLARQWRLLQLIDRPAGITVEDAAQSLGCAVRTIWRDLRVLEQAGFPIYDERAADGQRTVWKVSDTFKRSLPLKLTLGELVALVMSRDVMSPLGLSVLGPALSSAFDKIGAVLSKDAVRLLEQMREVVGVRALRAKLQLPMADHLPKLQTALVDHRTIHVRYHSFNRGGDTERSIDPYHLTYYDGGLYLIGRDHLRGAVRTFAVERIRSIDVLPGRFEIPGDFDPNHYLDEAWGVIRGELVTVRVVLAKSLAPYIRERLWHPSQKLRDLDDGRLELTLRVADTLEVRRWILGFGTQAEVVEPGALREAMRAEAEALSTLLAPLRRPLATVIRTDAGQLAEPLMSSRHTASVSGQHLEPNRARRKVRRRLS